MAGIRDQLAASAEEMFRNAAQRFGVQNMREHQLDVCLQYLKGKDSFFIAPTGFGKSLVYQVAPLVLHPSDGSNNGRIIIIQPTVALIDDSIKKLQQYVPELSAVHLTPATVTKSKSARYIFTSPEMILSDMCREKLLTDAKFMSTVTAVFVDECHIIEEWGVAGSSGKAFRQQYSELGQVRAFTSCPFIAMTATASHETIGFIKHSLNLQSCLETKIDIEKKNISYHVVSAKEDDLSNLDFLIELLKLKRQELEKTLVFFNSIKALTSAYTYMREEIDQTVGDPYPLLAMYMSVTSGERKESVINDINDPNGNIRVVLCTSSLAVGINVANVRYVIHYGAPKLAQDFLQETGRVAREYSAHGHSILITVPRMNARGMSDTMRAYILGSSCRRAILLKMFGSSNIQSISSLCCDVCNPTIDFSYKFAVDAYFPKEAQIGLEVSDSSAESEVSVGDVLLDSE